MFSTGRRHFHEISLFQVQGMLLTGTPEHKIPAAVGYTPDEYYRWKAADTARSAAIQVAKSLSVLGRGKSLGPDREAGDGK